MKALVPFAVVGLATSLFFAVPMFEQTAFLYVILLGPAIVFAGLLLFLTRDEGHSWRRRIGVFLASLAAYWIGEAIYGRFGDSLVGRWHEYFAPVLAAGAFLVGTRFCARAPLNLGGPWLLVLSGTFCSMFSVLPILRSGVTTRWGYACWGAHIFLWYVGVGPAAVAILKVKGPDQSSQHNAIAGPFSVIESRSSRG